MVGSVNLSGKEMVDKGLGKNWMTDYFEKIKKGPNTKKELESFVRNYPDRIYKIQSKIRQNVLIQKLFEEKTIEHLGETIEDLVKEVEFKGDTITFSAEWKRNLNENNYRGNRTKLS